MTALKTEGEKNGKPYKVFTITTEEGETYDTFESTFEQGKEYEVDVKPNANPQYNDNIFLPKERGWSKASPARNYEIEARVAALQETNRLFISGKITEAQFDERRKKFFEYIMNG